MKKQTMKQLRLGMAVLALCGMSAVGGGQTFAEVADADFSALQARVAALEKAAGVGESKESKVSLNAKTNNGDNGIAIGSDSIINATGSNAVAIGYSANTNSPSSIVIGDSASATISTSDDNKSGAIAIGQSATSLYGGAISLGTQAKGEGHDVVSIGTNSHAYSHDTMAIGSKSSAKGAYSLALGSTSVASGNAGIANGYLSKALGDQSIAIGLRAKAGKTATENNDDYTLVGSAAEAIAIGDAAKAYDDFTIALGNKATASADDGIAIGRASAASGAQSIALGYDTAASEEGGIAIGRTTKANNQYSIALGFRTTASADNAIAIGNGASVAVANAIALGQGSKVASGDGNVLSIGSDSLRRKIIHVDAGTANTDAANYGQLLKTATYTLQSSNSYSVTLQTNNGSNGPTIKLDVDGLKTNAGTTTTNADAASVSLNNINSEGIAKIASAVQVKAGDDSVKVTTGKDNNGNVTYTITSTGGGSVTGGGEIAANDDRAVSGDTVYQALGKLEEPAEGEEGYDKISTTNNVNQNLVALDSGKANTDLSNLSAAGKSEVKTLAKEAVKVTGGSGITVTGGDSPDSDGNITYNVSLNYDAIKGEGGVGGGKVESNDANLVSGGTMYRELRPTDGSYVKNGNTTAANLKALDTAIGGNDDYGADADDLNVITKTNDDGTNTSVKANLGKLDKAMGKVSALTDATNGVKGIDGKVIGGEGGKYSANLTGAVQAVNDKVGDFDTTEILKDEKGTALKDANGNDLKYHQLKSGLSVVQNMERFDQYMGDVNSLAGDDDGEGAMKDVKGNAVTKDQLAQTGLTGVVQLMDAKIGDLPSTDDYAYKGAIRSGVSVNDNLVNIDKAIGTDEDYGSELYNISTGDNVSLKKNIGALDAAIGTTADGAFVSSTNSVGQNLNALDRGLSDLGDRVNKVGAGAAALSALHVQDFDPDNKLNFAVGYGHYKNANAGAIGAFYKPNHDTTFSIASTIGNGDNMLNAGISFKIGTSSHVEKTMVVKADYEALQKKVADQDKRLAAQDERLASQDAQIEELKKQVAALIARG